MFTVYNDPVFYSYILEGKHLPFHVGFDVFKGFGRYF